MKVENQVQFTDIPEISIENLHEGVNQFQNDKLIIIFVNNCNEVETSISLVHYLVLFIVEKIAHLWFSRND